MTYPPQPGWPYEQPPEQHDQPQHAPAPQQPPYSAPPYGPPSGHPLAYGYPQQHGQPSYGGGPQPPRKNKTGLWIGLATAGAVVVVFLITGLVVPGFLLNGDGDGDDGATLMGPARSRLPEPTRAAESGTRAPETVTSGPTATPTDDGTGSLTTTAADELADELVTALNDGDAAAAKALVCDPRYTGGSNDFSFGMIDDVTEYEAALTSTPSQRRSGGGYATEVGGTVNDVPAEGSVVIGDFGSGACVTSFVAQPRRS